VGYVVVEVDALHIVSAAGEPAAPNFHRQGSARRGEAGRAGEQLQRVSAGVEGGANRMAGRAGSPTLVGFYFRYRAVGRARDRLAPFSPCSPSIHVAFRAADGISLYSSCCSPLAPAVRSRSCVGGAVGLGRLQGPAPVRGAAARAVAQFCRRCEVEGHRAIGAGRISSGTSVGFWLGIRSGGAARARRAGWFGLGGRRRQRLGTCGPVVGGASSCGIRALQGSQRVAGDAAGEGIWWPVGLAQAFLDRPAGHVGEVGRPRRSH